MWITMSIMSILKEKFKVFPGQQNKAGHLSGLSRPGKYAFKTSTQERMVVISGNLNFSPPHGVTKTIGPNREFIVEANASFDVEAT